MNDVRKGGSLYDEQDISVPLLNGVGSAAVAGSAGGNDEHTNNTNKPVASNVSIHAT